MPSEHVPACSHSAAKYAYGSIFLLASILSWVLRDTEFGYTSLKGMGRLKYCNGKADCLEEQGVFRMSFGCFMFFFVMFVSTVGTSEKDSCRGRWHSGTIGIWISKIVLIVLLIFISFFLPPEMISTYGGFAYAGAWVFLIFQSISIMSFINKINKWCHPEKDADKSKKYWVLLVLANIVIWVPIIFMFYWYVVRTFCKVNFLIILGTVIVIGGMYSLSLLPDANAISLRSSLMGTYVIFLCGSAIKSEPPLAKCSGWGGSDTSKVDALTIIGFVVAFGAMVFAVYSTGIDSQSFRVIIKYIPFIHKNKYHGDDDDGVPYGYGFFHLVFATASMYSAMLFVNWNIHHPSNKRFTIDSGWTSTWMKIGNELFAAVVYAIVLIADIYQDGDD
ncbi:unnamed protein product [Cuscuta europaea]|uniref:Uncharacterized protein n=1 Tax=Cuscuta europaea TaxID=41803 RepID=A0A9P0YL95_CUSEU|nr:unnamed protein product [Cuscuta europaea]